ncbi:MAG: 2-oxoacid:ferredoxin oxidoreductase subunit beta [Solirubrobacteraceae bacterium]
MSTTAEPTATLGRADFQSDQETRWCPGCGDYAILAAVQGIMPELGIPPERVAFITGIGCAGRFSYYMDTYGMHSIHGRAPTIATGLVAARDDLSVWIVSGDGDALSIGGNHLIHALRRDVPVKILLFNNRIYGLTKGQASPTSERGKVTKSTPAGSLERPLNPLATAIAAGATFAARAVDRDKAGLADVLRAAADHPGAAFVEILQNCPVFNDGAFSHVQDKDESVLHRIPLTAGAPIRFGRDDDRAVIRSDDGGLRIVPAAEADDASVVVHDPTATDPTGAFALSQLGIEEGHVPLGVLRRVPATPWGEGLVAERRAAHATVDDAALDRLLAGGDTWVVGGGR